MRPLKIRNALVCDYVAEGGGNKHVLVNVYSGDIVTTELPSRFPLGFYVEIVIQEGQGTDIALEIYLGRKKVGTLHAELEAIRIGLPMIFAVPMIPLKIERETELRVVAVATGFKRTTVLTKAVRRGTIDVPTVSLPPS